MEKGRAVILIVSMMAIALLLATQSASAEIPGSVGSEKAFIVTGGTGAYYTNDLAIVDTSTKQVDGVVHVSENGNLARIAVSPSGSHVVVTGYIEENIAIYRLPDLALVKLIDISNASAIYPTSIVMSHTGDKAYIVATQDATMKIITLDMASMTITSIVDTGMVYGGAAVSVDITADDAYVCTYNSTSIVRVTTATGAVAFYHVKNTNSSVYLSDVVGLHGGAAQETAMAFASRQDKRIYVYSPVANMMLYNLSTVTWVSKIAYDAANDAYYTCDYNGTAGNISKYAGWTAPSLQWNYTLGAYDSNLNTYSEGVMVSFNMGKKATFIYTNGTLSGNTDLYGTYPQDAVIATMQTTTVDPLPVTATFQLQSYWLKKWDGWQVVAYDSADRVFDTKVSDTRGIVSFVLISGRQYRLVASNATTGLTDSMTFTPDWGYYSSPYVIPFDIDITREQARQYLNLTIYTPGQNASLYIVSNVTLYSGGDSGPWYVTCKYYDPSATTTSVYLQLWEYPYGNNTSAWILGTYGIAGSQAFIYNFTIATDPKSRQFEVRYNITQSGLATNTTRVYDKTWPGPKWDLPLPEIWDSWFVASFIIAIALLTAMGTKSVPWTLFSMAVAATLCDMGGLWWQWADINAVRVDITFTYVLAAATWIYGHGKGLII